MNEGADKCVLCQFHSQECTFVQSPQPRKRRLVRESAAPGDESGSNGNGKKRYVCVCVVLVRVFLFFPRFFIKLGFNCFNFCFSPEISSCTICTAHPHLPTFSYTGDVGG